MYFYLLLLTLNAPQVGNPWSRKSQPKHLCSNAFSFKS